VITRLRERSDAVAPLKKPERPKDTDKKGARRLVGLLLALDVLTIALLVLAAGLLLSLFLL
jgi:hypothetical protein